MIGFFEVVIEPTNKGVHMAGRDKPNATQTWLVRAMTAGEALNAAAAHANYPDPSDVAQVSVRECKRYDNILVQLPLTK